jgi:hypothetical protein
MTGLFRSRKLARSSVSTRRSGFRSMRLAEELRTFQGITPIWPVPGFVDLIRPAIIRPVDVSGRVNLFRCPHARAKRAPLFQRTRSTGQPARARGRLPPETTEIEIATAYTRSLRPAVCGFRRMAARRSPDMRCCP